MVKMGSAAGQCVNEVLKGNTPMGSIVSSDGKLTTRKAMEWSSVNYDMMTVSKQGV
jgi:hypothetical protein